MKKDDFIAAVAKKCDMKQKEVEAVVDAMVLVIIETCVDGGDDINIPGLGHFKQKVNKAREGFNPIKKEKIQVPETHTLAFKPVKSVKKVIETKAAAKKSKKK